MLHAQDVKINVQDNNNEATEDEEEEENEEEPTTIDTWPRTNDEVFEALKVVAALQPKERFSTETPQGIFIQKPGTVLQSISRCWNGESRTANIKALEIIFSKAFRIVDHALMEREKFPMMHEDDYDRAHLIKRLKTNQLIGKIKTEVRNAKNGVVTLGETYSTDMKTKSKINLLVEKINNRLDQMELSLEFLNKRDNEND